MVVAFPAKGESIYTGKSFTDFTRFSCLIRRRKYKISWVRPTAKAGITTLPPRPKVRSMTLASSEV